MYKYSWFTCAQNKTQAPYMAQEAGHGLMLIHASNVTSHHSTINAQLLSTHLQSLKNTVFCSLCLSDPFQTFHGWFFSGLFHYCWKGQAACPSRALLWLFSLLTPYFPFHSSLPNYSSICLIAASLIRCGFQEQESC